MNLQGTYKINIEQSARKRIDGLIATTKRLLSHVGARGVSDPHGKEQQIQKLIGMFKENEDAVGRISLEISADRIIARNGEMEDVYIIKAQHDRGDGKVLLSLESDEMGSVQWDTTLCDCRYLLFESDDEMSEYVWERI